VAMTPATTNSMLGEMRVESMRIEGPREPWFYRTITPVNK
jgi:hypothetical protein